VDHRLPPTSPELLKDGTRPYFVWWADVTIADLRQKLAGADAEQRAYWLGAVLREANTRDVWLFTTPEQIRDAWPRLVRYLGTSRQRWAWLLDIPEPVWPPSEADRA
jgi:hypothetical protein